MYGLAATVSRALSFFLVPIYTRVFAPEDYGVISLVNTTIAVAAVFVALGLDSSAGRWYWGTSDDEDRRVTLSSWTGTYLATATALGIVVIAASRWLSDVTVGGPGAATYIRLAAVTLPLGVLVVVLTNFFRMQRRPWAAAAFSFATSTTNIALALLLVVGLHRGIDGVYQAQIGSAAFGSLIALYLVRDWIRPRWFRRERVREMLAYALPLVPAALAFWVVNLSDRYFVRVFGSTREVGIYQVANALAALVALVTVGFQQAWGPFALSIHREEGARRVYADALMLYGWVTCLVAVAISALAPEAIRVVATDRYAAAAGSVPYLALSYVVMGGMYIAALGANLTKTTKPVAAGVGLAALVNVGLNLLLVPSLGGVGAAISTLAAWVVMTGYVFARSQRLYPIPYRFVPAGALFTLSLALALAGQAWRPGSLAVAVAGKLALTALLIPAAFALRVVTREQIGGALARLGGKAG